jgi:hypothetical protein
MYVMLLPSMANTQLIPLPPVGPLPGTTAEPHLTLEVGFTGISGNDFRGTLDAGPAGVAKTITIHTSCCSTNVLGVEIKVDVFTDTITITVNASVRVAGLGFVTPVPGDASQLRLMTVYGVDASPGTALTSITGFNPGAPQIVPLSTEMFIGQARGIPVTYPAVSTTAVRIHDLLPMLPGVQPIFNDADLNSIVYVSTATVPTADFITLP